MEDFEVPLAKKARLDFQSAEITRLVPSPVDELEDFYDTPPARIEDYTVLKKPSENTMIFPRVDPSKPIFKLPGLGQSPSVVGGEYATKLSTENVSGMSQAGTNGDLPEQITFLPAEIAGGHGVEIPEILRAQGYTTNHAMIDEAIGTDSLENRGGIAESGQGPKLTEVEEASPKRRGTIDVVDGIEFMERSPSLSQQSPVPEKVFEMLTPPMVRPLSLDPNFSLADSSKLFNENKLQPLLSHKASNNAVGGDTNLKDAFKGVKDILVQTDKLKTNFQVTRPVLSNEGVLLEGESRISANKLLPNVEMEANMPGVPFTKAIAEEIDGNSATNFDTDLKFQKIAETEFELDSSPIESSLDGSSNSSSDDSSDDDYEMLDPAEQARRLMQEDGGSEDESGKKGAINGPLRTLHERPDEVVEKPHMTLTADMKIEELGTVETLVENHVLVKAKTTGEYQVLETGSILCIQDRTVVGVVAETLGRVQQPLYSIRFTNANAIEQAGLSKGICIYYVPQFSTYVFTQTLKTVKGSDASNIYDEEVGDDELEFSDDEAEAEYKKGLKLRRQVRREGRGGVNNKFSRIPQSNKAEHMHQNDGSGIGKSEDISINYDDISVDDDHYTPLARPSDLHEQMRQGETLSISQRGNRNNGHRGGRSRGDSSRSRSGRGGARGRGSEQHRRGGSRASSDRQQPSDPRLDLSIPPALSATRLSNPLTLSRPPLPPPPHHPAESPYFPSQQHQHHGYNFGRSFEQHQHSPCDKRISHNYPPQPPSPNFQPPYQQHPQHGQISSQQYHTQLIHPSGQPLPSYASGPIPPSYTTPSLPPGAFVNPVFFGNNYQQLPSQQPFAPHYGGYPPPYNSYSNGHG